MHLRPLWWIPVVEERSRPPMINLGLNAGQVAGL